MSKLEKLTLTNYYGEKIKMSKMNKLVDKLESTKPEDKKKKEDIIKSIRNFRAFLKKHNNEIFIRDIKREYENMTKEERLKKLFE